MGFKERVSIILDVDGKAGSAGLKSFGASIRDADGVVGKFKAGATGAMDSVKANAGTMALAGGAALVAFGVKALGAFTDVAMGARDLGAAVGTNVEDASRWIAVADDMGLTAADLTAGFGAVTKSLDADKWDKYGIATRDAAGSARDANDILLDTFDVLSKETNLTERARLGKELLGKGYASLAPMIGKSREEYEKMLGSVEKGQVITAKEAEKAQRMAKAQDALSDALNEVTLAAGEMVAEMAPTIEALSSAVTEAIELQDALGPIPDLMKAVASPVQAGVSVVDWMKTGSSTAIDYSQSLEELRSQMIGYGATGEQLVEVMNEWHEVNGVTKVSADSFQESLLKMVGATDKATTAEAKLTNETAKVKAAMREVAGATADAERAYESLTGEISEEQSWLNLLDNIDAYNAKQADASASDREKQQSTNALRLELIEYTKNLQGIPPQKQTEILALLDQGKIAEVQYTLGVLTADRNIRLGFTVGNVPVLPGSKYASGTNNAKPGLALVGEQGPELMVMKGGEQVIPAGQTAAMLSGGGSPVGGGGTVINANIYVQSITDDAAINAALRRIQRRGFS